MMVIVLLAGCCCLEKRPSDPDEGMACASNTKEVILSLVANYLDGYFPSDLRELLAEVDNPKLLLCPHKRSGRTPDESDYIYLSNLFEPDTSGAQIAVVICPPENHAGRYGHVAFSDGAAFQLNPSDTVNLIRDPFLRVTNWNQEKLDRVRSKAKLRVPVQLQNVYRRNLSRR